MVLNKEYNRVILFTINGFKIGAVQPDEVAESACLSTMDPGRNVNVIAIGCDYGIIRYVLLTFQLYKRSNHVRLINAYVLR